MHRGHTHIIIIIILSQCAFSFFIFLLFVLVWFFFFFLPSTPSVFFFFFSCFLLRAKDIRRLLQKDGVLRRLQILEHTGSLYEKRRIHTPFRELIVQERQRTTTTTATLPLRHHRGLKVLVPLHALFVTQPLRQHRERLDLENPLRRVHPHQHRQHLRAGLRLNADLAQRPSDVTLLVHLPRVPRRVADRKDRHHAPPPPAELGAPAARRDVEAPRVVVEAVRRHQRRMPLAAVRLRRPRRGVGLGGLRAQRGRELAACRVAAEGRRGGLLLVCRAAALPPRAAQADTDAAEHAAAAAPRRCGRGHRRRDAAQARSRTRPEHGHDGPVRSFHSSSPSPPPSSLPLLNEVQI
eukprot:Rhum_TRINITY_DN26359_c0_g1::Rhum_TRINITY_DN26359_c0_g1_i1::g.183664::m.183664